jgi:hypothetical protein
LSLSVFVAGFGHAMPVDSARLVGAGAAASHPHCEEHAAQAMPGAIHDDMHAPSHKHSDKHQVKGGCCKTGSCPCPHVTAIPWESAAAVGPLGRHASDFAPLRNDYRSPALQRLIRPPIA